MNDLNMLLPCFTKMMSDSRVTVLAVFGKSGRIGGAADKARIARETTQKDVFGAKTAAADRDSE